jgi:deazaflavin-dependent oxidoreductase (nitroreductase family)
LDDARPSRLQARGLKAWTRFHRWVYQRTDGKVLSRMRGKPTLLLTTTGRRSGRPHTIPLPYLADGDTMLVIGSASGAERHPDWVLNLIANPRVTVQYLADSGPAQAEILAGAERAAMWDRISVEAPWYAGYQQRTSREIPLIRLTRQTQPISLA